MKSTTLIAPALLLALVGCGSGDEPEANQSGQPQAVASSAAPASAPPVTEPASDPAKAVPAAAFRPALLKLSDIPSGYEQRKYDPDDDTDDDTFLGTTEECQRKYDKLNGVEDAVVDVGVAFESEGATLEQSWGSFNRSAESVNKDVTAVGEAFRECPKVTIEGDDGEPYPLTFAPVDGFVEEFGEDAYAYTGSTTIQGFPISFTIAFVQVDNSIMFVTQGGLGASDTGLVKKAAKVVLERFEAAQR